MEIKLLGMRVLFGKEKTISTETGVGLPPMEPKASISFAPRLHPITNAINWPNPGDDPWAKTILSNAVLGFDKSAKYGHFNVCPITELVREMGILLSAEGQFAIDRLRSIHCIKWALMEKEVLDAIVPMINMIFKGRSFETVNANIFDHLHPNS